MRRRHGLEERVAQRSLAEVDGTLRPQARASRASRSHFLTCTTEDCKLDRPRREDPIGRAPGTRPRVIAVLSNGD